MYKTSLHHDNRDVTPPHILIVGVVSRGTVPLSSLLPHTTHHCISVVPPTQLPLVTIDNDSLPLATTPKTPDRGTLKRPWLTPSRPPFTPPPLTHPHIHPRRRSRSAPVLKTTLSQLLLRPLTVDVERCGIPSPSPVKVGVAATINRRRRRKITGPPVTQLQVIA